MVDVACDLTRTGSAVGEVLDEGEGVRCCTGVGEGAGVGEDTGVDTGGHGWRDVDVCGNGNVVDHGGYGAGVLVDPVDGAEEAAAGVVIDVDEGAVFEAEEAGAGYAVAFEQDCGGASAGIDVVGGWGMADSANVGQREIGSRDWVGEYDVGLTAELIEDLGEREDGAYGVPVGTSVRGEEEARIRAEGRQQIVDSGCVRLDFEDLGFWGHDLAGTPEAGVVAGGSDEERF